VDDECSFHDAMVDGQRRLVMTLRASGEMVNGRFIENTKRTHFVYVFHSHAKARAFAAAVLDALAQMPEEGG
jgi:hypothetical protein